MTHQPNNHYNSYKEGLDLEFLRSSAWNMEAFNES